MTQPTYEEDGIPFYGPDPFADRYGGESFDDPSGPWDGGDAGDLAAMAREARMMAQMMGEPLDAGFDAALRHVEAGADPDDVFGELDAVEEVGDLPSAKGDPG